jgi:hypothetical protein
MVLFLAPVVIAGYMYWEKHLKEGNIDEGRRKDENESPSEEENLEKFANGEGEHCSVDNIDSVETVDMNDENNGSPTYRNSPSSVSTMASTDDHGDDHDVDDGKAGENGESQSPSSIGRVPLRRTTPTSNQQGPWDMVRKIFEEGPNQHQVENCAPGIHVAEDGQKYFYHKGQRIAMPKIAYK